MIAKNENHGIINSAQAKEKKKHLKLKIEKNTQNKNFKKDISFEYNSKKKL